ncbi:hypothetical protein KR038_004361 [Drosophila bunnanda]|nr:hypothetical protein KR038_004361 [Drosophila bunnanda]
MKQPISTSVRHKSTSKTNKVNVVRQSKIFNSLVGNRREGNTRWYPSHDVNTKSRPPSFPQSASSSTRAPKFGGVSHSRAHLDSRRMSVLNKMFMTTITDFLATGDGDAARSIVGRGLQVSHVKITSNFSQINVYWSCGSSAEQANPMLEEELNRCSGQLQHELSQLNLMGEVPRIKFVRDKTSANLCQVQEILARLGPFDIGTLPSDSDTSEGEVKNSSIKHSSNADSWPQMRQDVVNLNQSIVMDKILTKMHKFKDAWVSHMRTLSNDST